MDPADPHYHVRYFQNGLPFSATELLVEDDSKTAPWKVSIEREDGTTKLITHHPLYTESMRETVKRRLEKLVGKMRPVTAGPAKVGLDQIGPQDPEDEIDPRTLEFGPDEVNLASFMRGEIEYEPNEVYTAVKKAYTQNLHTLRQVVEYLVLDVKLVPEELLADRFVKMLPQAE